MASKQGTVDTADLGKEQIRFVLNVMAMLMDELIQDDMDIDMNGKPTPADEQSNPTISKAMKLLQYK